MTYRRTGRVPKAISASVYGIDAHLPAVSVTFPVAAYVSRGDESLLVPLFWRSHARVLRTPPMIQRHVSKIMGAAAGSHRHPHRGSCGFTRGVRIFPLRVEPLTLLQPNGGPGTANPEGPGRNRGNLLNALGDGVAVNGTGGDDLKDRHIESSLRNSAFSGGMVGT